MDENRFEVANVVDAGLAQLQIEDFVPGFDRKENVSRELRRCGRFNQVVRSQIEGLTPIREKCGYAQIRPKHPHVLNRCR